MIRSLRRRFIFSSMAAFAILLLALLASITAVAYLQTESRGQRFMQSILEQQQHAGGARPRGAKPDLRERPDENPIAYYAIAIDAQGEITDIQEKGVWEPDLELARDCAARVLACGRIEGKIDGFSYLLKEAESGGAHLVLMDNSIQMHTLIGILRISICLSFGCLGLLFLILLPISSRVVRSYALHIEKQKQFITNAGHEIKTPVAIIRSNVDAMELIQGENKWSKNIRSQTDRLSALLQRLLFMARIDEKSLLLPKEQLQFNALLGAELDAYGAAIAERNLHLKCDLSANIGVMGNRESLQQMLRMLLDNAVQYADAGGEIEIRLERKRRKLRLLLENSVRSLPDCAADALFDRFFRGDSARTQSTGGYGIGLSAARSIAEMHGGNIAAEYIGAQRIRFIVELSLR